MKIYFRLAVGFAAFLILAPQLLAVDLTGRFEATVAPLQLERDLVASWLPEGTELGRDGTDQDDTLHTVFFMMGDQYNVALGMPIYRHYAELIVVIPKVMFGGREYVYWPKLYLSNRAAVNGGRSMYGFPKEFADVRSSREAFSIQNWNSDRLLLSAAIDPEGARELSSDNPNVKQVLGLLPVETLVVMDGRIQCTEFAMRNVTIKSARIDALQSSGALAGLDGYENQWDSIENAPLGAFFLNARWRVPPVRDCP